MNENQMEPNFSTLVLSIASSAAMSMGLAAHPESNKVEKDLPMAKFNIDLLVLLIDKTKGNLTKEEDQFVTMVVSDLQMKFVEINK